MTLVEQNVTHIKVVFPVRYCEEDIPNDFPLRIGNVWSAHIEIESGKIEGWPQGESGKIYMKVCDSGCYYLYDGDTQIAARENEYVPCSSIPGEDGDYVDFKINEDGIITNWFREPDFSVFFEN